MLVDVSIHIEILGYRLSSRLFRGSVNVSKRVGNGQPHCKGMLTGREEDGFVGILQNQRYAQPEEERHYDCLCT